jgi:hypothetical protein
LCSVHDAVEFEKRGIPATVILTESFKKAAEFQFRGKGMEGHPYVMVPHPVSNLTTAEMRQVTLRVADAVASQLKA